MSHKPPGLSVLLLDDIPALFGHPQTTVIAQTFKGKQFMCMFPSGQLYFESKLALDTDGSPVYAPQDPDGQLATSTTLADGSSLDSDVINYFVLPGGFGAAHGIRRGDIAVVINGSGTPLPASAMSARRRASAKARSRCIASWATKPSGAATPSRAAR